MADSLIAEANELFVDDDYDKALVKFNEAIALDGGKDGSYFTKRSACLYKLSRFNEALQDAKKATELTPQDAAAHMRKGMAAFSLEDYPTALSAFKTGDQIKTSATFKTWIRKCEAELGEAAASIAPSINTSLAAPAAAEEPAATPAPPRFKHDFYQTQTHVTVNVFAKGVKKPDVTINIKKKELEIAIRLGEGNDFCLDFDLCGEVVPEESRYDVLSTKIEIKLKKAEVGQWPTLEDSGVGVQKWGVVSDAPSSTSKGVQYPSSSKKAVNWEKITVDEDKLEGDAALNQVFQQIYKNADDDQRRAMMKSFSESGGTVLSTNWKEVGSGEVRGSPPQGMEMKQWRDLHH